MNLRLGYNTWSMPTLPIDDVLALCGGLGYDSIELTVCPGWPTDASTTAPAERRRIGAAARDAGLAISGLTGNTPVLGAGWTEHREFLAHALDFAAEVRPDDHTIYVTTTTGHEDGIHPSLSWEPHRHEIAERFGQLADLAAQRGVMMHLEPNVATACRTVEQALWILQQVGSPSLRLTLDISHFEVQGADRATVVRALGPYAGAVEVKDERGVEPDFEFLIPGEGEMDYAAFLGELVEIGYDGTVSVEISVYRQRVPGYDPVAAAVQSYAVLDAAFRAVGMRPAA